VIEFTFEAASLPFPADRVHLFGLVRVIIGDRGLNMSKKPHRVTTASVYCPSRHRRDSTVNPRVGGHFNPELEDSGGLPL
jgi:hypothetical protein